MTTKSKKDQAQEAPEDPLAGLSDDNANPFVEELLGDADALGEEKQDLLKRIDDNRQALRLIARTGHLSEKQAAAIKLWYPERKKGEAEAEANGTANAEGAAA